MTAPIENQQVAAIQALANHEAKYGALTPEQRLIFKLGFYDGIMWGMDRASQINKETHA